MSISFDTVELLVTVLSVALVVCSASLHEFGHAYMAHRLGDDTAKERGRMTANPLAHIDPIGSVALPLLLSLSGAGYMAYAKPVPYNPNRLRNPRRDEALVALAGPLANVVQALAGGLCYHLAMRLVYGNENWPYHLYYLDSSPVAWVVLALQLYVQVNCSLAFFNLLPLPPLDGSKLLLPLLKGKARWWYYNVQRYALPITMALIWLLPNYLGVDPLGWWLDVTAGTLSTLILGW